MKYIVMDDSNDILAVCDSPCDAQRFQVETILEWLEHPYRMGIPVGMSDLVEDNNFVNELLHILLDEGPTAFLDTWREYVCEEEYHSLEMIVVEGPEINSSIEPLDNLRERAKMIYTTLNGEQP